MMKCSLFMAIATFIVTISAWNIEWYQDDHCNGDTLNNYRIEYGNSDMVCGSCKIPGEPDDPNGNCAWFPVAQPNAEQCTIGHTPQPLSFRISEGTKCKIGIDKTDCDGGTRIFGKSHVQDCLSVTDQLDPFGTGWVNGAKIYFKCGYEDEDLEDGQTGCF